MVSLSMTNPSPFHPKEFKKEAIEAIQLLVVFLKNPMQGMRNIPVQWHPFKLMILMGALSAACGVLSGIVNREFLAIFAGIFVYPISTLLVLFIFSGLFYYIFLFFFKRELPFFEVLYNVAFASIPALLISPLTGVIPPLSLVGIAMGCILLIVGFVDNFHLPKKSITKLLAGVFLIHLIIWMLNTISFQQKRDAFKAKHLPESLDILEKELKN